MQEITILTCPNWVKTISVIDNEKSTRKKEVANILDEEYEILKKMTLINLNQYLKFRKFKKES